MGRTRKPKDGFRRDVIYSLRMPADLREWMDRESKRRTAEGRKTSPADLTIEALRKMRTLSIWKRGVV